MKFTITKTNHTGLMEWLTEEGFRSEKAIKEKNIEKMCFSKEEGSKKVSELRANARCPKTRKSIILNYS